MSQTLFTFWLNTDVKDQFREVCNQVGLSLTEALTGSAMLVSREKCLFFDIATAFESDGFEPDDHLFYSEKNIAELARRAQELDEGKGDVHEFIKVNE